MISWMTRSKPYFGTCPSLWAAGADVFEASDIWIMNADGSAQTKLMDAYGFGDGPVWQP
jgi:hypothetical protein